MGTGACTFNAAGLGMSSSGALASSGADDTSSTTLSEPTSAGPSQVVRARTRGPQPLVIAERSDGQYFKIEAQHRSGDKIVLCRVGQRTGTGRPDDVPVPNFAATKAWAEKLCLSLKIE